MGACFCKYSVAEKEKMKKMFEKNDYVDLQFVLSMRMLRFTNSMNKNIEDFVEIENLSKALLSHNPNQIHIALHTCSGITPHNPDECHYKTFTGCKCPLSICNVSYA
jgi:hypothetical protein